MADSGIGIDTADQERIFEKFVQVDSSSTRRYNGTGLGLAIVREYAEMHGGSVSVESELGPGSLPLSCASLCLARFREKRQRRTRNLIAGLVAKASRRENNHESTH